MTDLARRLSQLVKNWRHNISLAPLNAQVEARTLAQAADQVDALLRDADILAGLTEARTGPPASWLREEIERLHARTKACQDCEDSPWPCVGCIERACMIVEFESALGAPQKPNTDAAHGRSPQLHERLEQLRYTLRMLKPEPEEYLGRDPYFSALEQWRAAHVIIDELAQASSLRPEAGMKASSGASRQQAHDQHVADLEAQVGALTAALQRYGQHTNTCGTRFCAVCHYGKWLHDVTEDLDEVTCLQSEDGKFAPKPCNCGFTALHAPEPTTPDGGDYTQLDQALAEEWKGNP